jgi:hypothetical protein
MNVSTILSGLFGRLAGGVAIPPTRDILPDLENVGQTKMLGYLPLSSIEEFCTKECDQLIAEAKAKNLAAVKFSRYQTTDYSGSLYIYDREKLQEFLNEPYNHAILKKSRWPTDADKFVVKVASVEARNPSPLYNLIAFAFGHTGEQYNNRPVYDGGESGARAFIRA